jgi:transcriptional regulator with XRE-family HTH domain
MSPSPAIPVSPEILRWAREASGYPTGRVASRLGVKEERVQSWEQGERQPTERQLEDLAKILRRPLGVFFLPRPPRPQPLGAEYRRLTGVTPGQESPEPRIALRQMLSRRESALNLMEELGSPRRITNWLGPEPSSRMLDPACWPGASHGARLHSFLGGELPAEPRPPKSGPRTPAAHLAQSATRAEGSGA